MPLKMQGYNNRGDENNPRTPNICGSSPQPLLDDLINTANNTVQNGVNGLEEFLRWCQVCRNTIINWKRSYLA